MFPSPWDFLELFNKIQFLSFVWNPVFLDRFQFVDYSGLYGVHGLVRYIINRLAYRQAGFRFSKGKTLSHGNNRMLCYGKCIIIRHPERNEGSRIVQV
jgi:hypothetical protein